MEAWIERQPRRHLELLALDIILNDPTLFAQLKRCSKRQKISLNAKSPAAQASLIFSIPDDVTRKILSFLNVFDRATCSTLVCWEWTRIKTMDVFRDIDFEGLTNPGILHLNSHIIGLFKHLEIRFDTVRKLDLYDLQGHIVAMRMLLRRCINLTHLRLHGTKITNSVLYSIQSTKLESLIITDGASIRKRVSYTGQAMKGIISKCQRLSNLAIGKAPLNAAFAMTVFHSVAFQNLRSVTLSCFSNLIAGIISTFPQLEELTVDCIYPGNIHSAQLSSYTSRLRSIHIKSIMPHFGKNQLHGLFHILVELLSSCRMSLNYLCINGKLEFVRPGYVSRFINAMKIMPVLISFKLNTKISLRKLEALRLREAQFPNLKEFILKEAVGTSRYNRTLQCLTLRK